MVYLNHKKKNLILLFLCDFFRILYWKSARRFTNITLSYKNVFIFVSATTLCNKSSQGMTITDARYWMMHNNQSIIRTRRPPFLDWPLYLRHAPTIGTQSCCIVKQTKKRIPKKNGLHGRCINSVKSTLINNLKWGISLLCRRSKKKIPSNNSKSTYGCLI